MNELRKEIRELLSRAESTRPPALRRSLQEEFLYATDLPQTASAATVASFCTEAETAGWQVRIADGWILMDRIPEIFAPRAEPDGPEARCCASLLKRHTERKNGDREKRMLIKAAEEGAEAYERACGILHREWAAALRKGEKLPDLPDDYFTGGQKTC